MTAAPPARPALSALPFLAGRRPDVDAIARVGEAARQLPRVVADAAGLRRILARNHVPRFHDWLTTGTVADRASGVKGRHELHDREPSRPAGIECQHGPVEGAHVPDIRQPRTSPVAAPVSQNPSHAWKTPTSVAATTTGSILSDHGSAWSLIRRQPLRPIVRFSNTRPAGMDVRQAATRPAEGDALEPEPSTKENRGRDLNGPIHQRQNAHLHAVAEDGCRVRQRMHERIHDDAERQQDVQRRGLRTAALPPSASRTSG